MKRAVAHRFWIKKLGEGQYSVGSDINSPTHIALDGLKVTRVDLVGKVREKSENLQSQYSYIVLEDKSGKIKVKTFGNDTVMLKDLNINDLVRVIGKIRQDDKERFIIGEIVKKLADANYALLREKELGKQPDDKKLVEEIEF